MFRRMAVVRTDISEERIASIIRVTRIGELGTTLATAATETSALTTATRRNIPEDGIFFRRSTVLAKQILTARDPCTVAGRHLRRRDRQAGRQAVAYL
jgi:mRNA-degrading endonuclease toxin of MazEF toxin-antitoxin module